MGVDPDDPHRSKEATMDAPVEISFRHFEPTDRIKARIDEHIAALEAYEDGIVGGRVVIDGKNRHGTKTVVDIVVELSYRGGVAIGRRSGEFPSPAGQQTFDTALAEAFHAAESQVKQHFKKRRPQDVKDLEHQAAHGRIAKLDPAVRNGFIEMPDGETLFFSEAVLEGEFDRLSEGDEVMAIAAEAESPYGPQASQVRPIGPLA
jgi:ribosome-associated translation inhibitor RaiA/cold shock CspA family protein